MFLLSTGCLIESACFLYKGFFLPPGVVFFLFQSLCCLPFAMLYLSLWWWVTKVFSARQNVVVVLHCGDSSYPRLFPASSCFSAALSSLVFVPPRFFSFSPLWWGVICKPLVVSPVYILLLLHQCAYFLLRIFLSPAETPQFLIPRQISPCNIEYISSHKRNFFPPFSVLLWGDSLQRICFIFPKSPFFLKNLEPLFKSVPHNYFSSKIFGRKYIGDPIILPTQMC